MAMYICKDLKCARCGCEMQFWREENIQLSESSLGTNMGNMLAGVIKAKIFACPQCKKLELISAEDIPFLSGENTDTLQCPDCGTKHARTPLCPICGYNYKYCPKCDELNFADASLCTNCKFDFTSVKEKKGLAKFFG